MRHDDVHVPAVVRARAAAAPGGRSWADDLPRVLEELERSWSVTVTEPLPGGTASFVARATTQDGRPVVVKVAVPGSGLGEQARTLAAAAGHGYVRLLAHDARHDALLLEALGPSLPAVALSPTAQLSVLAGCLRRAWALAPETGQEPVDKAAGLVELVEDLWRRLDRPCSVEVVEHALACARRRSAAFTDLVDTGTCVVVHGDAAAANAARVLAPRPGTEDGFVLLDPDAFLGDPAYDLGVAVRDWCPQLLASDRPVDLLAGYCHHLGEETAHDPEAIWEWGFLERVSTGLVIASLVVASLGDGEARSVPHLLSAQHLLRDRASRGSVGT